MKTKKKTHTRDKYYSVTQLKDRGWTDTMIKKLLKRLRPKKIDNPFFACAAPMKLYLKKSVEKIENTEEFKIALEKSKKRKISSEKAVETKVDKTLKEMEEFSIYVERIPLDTLRKETLDAKQAWYFYQAEIRDDFPIENNAYNADEETVERWEVNYIRHNLTNYDYELSKLKSKVGKYIAYAEYHKKLMNKMEEVYPELKNAIRKNNKFQKQDETGE